MGEGTGSNRTGAPVIAEAASNAPSDPGVYVMLDRLARLIYVGKATDLRRRLRQHADGAAKRSTRRDAMRAKQVREVRWIVCADVDEAERLEADLIVAFQPVLNGSLATDGRWVTVVTTVVGGDPGKVRLQLVPDGATPAPTRSGSEAIERAYGCFAHLGVGVSSTAAIAASEGYAALCRLLWAAGEPAARADYPRAIATPSPPNDVTLPFDPERAAALHRFLSGTSSRMLDDLLAAAEERRSPVQLPALRRDRTTAGGFFTAAARPLRDLRRRHGLPVAPLDRATIVGLLAADLRAAVGELDLRPLRDPTEGLLGARASRQRAVRGALRRRR